DRPVVERRPLRAIDRRLAVLGAYDDQRLVGEAAVTQRVHELPDRAVHKRDGVGEVDAWRCGRIDVAADFELLADADGLEIHSENRRGSATALAGMVESIDLVDDRLDLDAVIPLNAVDRAGEVAARYDRGRRRRGMKAERCDQIDIGGAKIGI